MIGRKLGHYKLQSLLGAGGMGEVYRARDLRLDRDVAVKILPAHLADNDEALRRFEREAKAVAALSHPNILAIHDFGTEEGINYAVMELLQGETLRARLSRGTMNWRESVKIAIAIADGLATAHTKGIIHRDLKPENVFLTNDGQVKILDFGVARVKQATSPDSKTITSDATRPGILIGTIGYMSPEQVRGEAADAPSDLFSLGGMLYEMLEGRHPFAAVTQTEMMAAILRDDPPTLRAISPQIPLELERIVRRCLEKRSVARFQSASDLAFDLRSLLDDKTSAVIQATAKTSRRRFVTIGAVALALLGAFVALTRFYPLQGKAIESLAVLPLINSSGDANVEYLSDGITESIINSLSQLPKLRVMARSTVFSYKDRKFDPRQAGQELKVQAVLTGNVSQRGDTLVIGAELVNVADGTRLWGDQYNRKLADLISIQAEIAKQISERLRLKLSGEEQQRLTKHYTENTEAYQLYLKGRFFSTKYTSDGIKKGIEYLNQAIDIDPTYALAHAGLASCYYDSSDVFLPPREAMPRAKAAASQALKLDETLAEAHTILAVVEAAYEWDWPDAEKGFKRAIDLNPSYAQAHQYYAFYLMQQGRLNEAIAEMTQARDLDPLSIPIGTNLAWFYYLAHRPDESITQLRKIIEIAPNFPMAHYNLGQAFEQKRMFDDAIAEYNRAKLSDPGQSASLSFLGHGYAVAGKKSEAEQMLAEMEKMAKERHVESYHFAIVFIGLGENDQALAWLEKAYQERSEMVLNLKVDPMFDSLRSDPRFIDLLRRLKLGGLN